MCSSARWVTSVGSLSAVYCACAAPGHPGHGPQWNLTRKVDGRTVTKPLKPGWELDKARRRSPPASGYGQVGSQDLLVARSWDLGALEKSYESFIEEFTGLDPATDEAALRAQTRLVHEWRRFPFLDPRLPARLLPDNWRER
jgi:PaaX-like protein C-terminal domain/Family of unknown function (DUF6788)